MRLLFKVAFWLAVVLALLPSVGPQPTPKLNVSALDAVVAAKATVDDLQTFCARQPDTCAVGSQAAVAFGHRAQAGAKLLYEYLSEQLGPYEGAGTSTREPVPLPPARPPQYTLSGHLAPPSPSPNLRKESRGNRPDS